MKGQGSPERGENAGERGGRGTGGWGGHLLGRAQDTAPRGRCFFQESCLGLVTPGPGLGDAHPCGPRPQHRTASLCAARPQARGPPRSAHQPALFLSMTVVAHLHGPWQLHSRP